MRAPIFVLLVFGACAPWSSTGATSGPSIETCACETTTLAEQDGFPIAFGTDDANVYWSSPSRSFMSPPISAVAKDGGIATAAPGSGYQVTGTIVADTSALYAPCESNLSGLDRFPKDGGPMTDLAPGQVVSEVRLDATADVFWAGGGGIWKKPPGHPAVQVVTDDVITFAIDAAGIYWWGLGREIHSTVTPTIASAEVPLGGLAADGAALYWLDSNAQTVNVAPHGGSPSVLLNGLQQPSAIALDDTFVYAVGVFEQHYRVVIRVPKSGGPPEVLYVGGDLSGLAVDAAAAYTTDTRTDSANMTMYVVRIAKP